MNYSQVKLSNENRIQSMNSAKRNKNDPPKRKYKQASYLQFMRIKKSLGYDIEFTEESKSLKWCCEDFGNKFALYNGGKYRRNKMGRIDKIKAKEETGFKMVKNPFLSKLEKMCRILNGNFVQPAFDSIYE